MAVTIDTLKAATRLREEGGFDEQQATALVATFADGFVENLATKDDVEKLEVSLRGDIDHLRGDVEHLRGDVEKLEKKVALRTDLERTEAKMLGEMSKLAQRLTVRFGGAVGAGIGILVALDKLF